MLSVLVRQTRNDPNDLNRHITEFEWIYEAEFVEYNSGNESVTDDGAPKPIETLCIVQPDGGNISFSPLSHSRPPNLSLIHI